MVYFICWNPEGYINKCSAFVGEMFGIRRGSILHRDEDRDLRRQLRAELRSWWWDLMP